jgi:hypothetical protein
VLRDLVVVHLWLRGSHPAELDTWARRAAAAAHAAAGSGSSSFTCPPVLRTASGIPARESVGFLQIFSPRGFRCYAHPDTMNGTFRVH